MNKINTKFVIVCLAAIITFGAAAEEKKPNLIFVLTDQWRRQALGFMNEDPVLTPNLDRFSKEAAVFTHAVATVPVCAPDRAVLLTGNYPLRNGVLANDMRLDENSQSLGVVCKKAGYRTGYVGKWHIDGVRGFTPPGKRRQGFDFWYKSIYHHPFNQPYYIQDNPEQIKVQGWAPTYATDTAIDFMKEKSDKPFALVVSYAPPHNGGGKGMENTHTPGMLDEEGKQKYGYGYKAPQEFEAPYRTDEFNSEPRRPNVMPVKGKFESAPAIPGYFGAITALDHEFGRLVDYLKDNGLLENTIIIFTSDHGEMMGSQGRMTKGVWYEESIGVPCLIGGAGIQPQRIVSPFNAVDVMPTLIGLMGIDKPEMDGTDFSPLLTGGDMEVPEFSFLSFYKGGAPESYRQWRAVYSERFTYVTVDDWAGWENSNIPQNGVATLYDRKADPFQQEPIFRGEGADAIMDKMHAALKLLLEEQNDPFLENCWVGRSGEKTVTDPTARYDALIDRYYKQVQ
tara:strand:+ start:27112 stop:28641 length:1530 start_codon:yes stop_codon:yes gene_type:complete